ncbi:hypothetical protein BJ741DRAFT_645575 [Chytriomyces cf. hyalinus JEL632]|nr:hypothetical protein BJ741DRAFT_645575 [Chytriomyces cf. hyalinus JEL632]
MTMTRADGRELQIHTAHHHVHGQHGHPSRASRKPPAKTSAEFHALFTKVPAKERLVETFVFAFFAGKDLSGRLWVTERHLCVSFHSAILNIHALPMLPFARITAVSRRNSLGDVPNGIVIEDKDHAGAALELAGFNDRDAVFELLNRLWTSNCQLRRFSGNSMFSLATFGFDQPQRKALVNLDGSSDIGDTIEALNASAVREHRMDGARFNVAPPSSNPSATNKLGNQHCKIHSFTDNTLIYDGVFDLSFSFVRDLLCRARCSSISQRKPSLKAHVGLLMLCFSDYSNTTEFHVTNWSGDGRPEKNSDSEIDLVSGMQLSVSYLLDGSDAVKKTSAEIVQEILFHSHNKICIKTTKKVCHYNGDMVRVSTIICIASSSEEKTSITAFMCSSNEADLDSGKSKHSVVRSLRKRFKTLELEIRNSLLAMDSSDENETEFSALSNALGAAIPQHRVSSTVGSPIFSREKLWPSLTQAQSHPFTRQYPSRHRKNASTTSSVLSSATVRPLHHHGKITKLRNLPDAVHAPQTARMQPDSEWKDIDKEWVDDISRVKSIADNSMNEIISKMLLVVLIGVILLVLLNTAVLLAMAKAIIRICSFVEFFQADVGQ